MPILVQTSSWHLSAAACSRCAGACGIPPRLTPKVLLIAWLAACTRTHQTATLRAWFLGNVGSSDGTNNEAGNDKHGEHAADVKADGVAWNQAAPCKLEIILTGWRWATRLKTVAASTQRRFLTGAGGLASSVLPI